MQLRGARKSNTWATTRLQSRVDRGNGSRYLTRGVVSLEVPPVGNYDRIVVPADTSTEAAAAQLAMYRSMTGSERSSAALEISSLARELTWSGIQARNPAWTDRQITVEFVRIVYCDDLAVLAYGNDGA